MSFNNRNNIKLITDIPIFNSIQQSSSSYSSYSSTSQNDNQNNNNHNENKENHLFDMMKKINSQIEIFKIANNESIISKEEEKAIKDIKFSSNLVRDLICILMNLKTTKNISEDERKSKNNSIGKVYKSIREKAKKYKEEKSKYINISSLIDNFFDFTSLVHSGHSSSSSTNSNSTVFRKTISNISTSNSSIPNE
jgi:site-specific DNA-adenine methylase